MVKACRFRGWQAILIIGLSVGIIILLFWTAVPIVAPPNGSVAVR